MARRSYPKNTKLPSCNPSDLHPPLLMHHLTSDRGGNEVWQVWQVQLQHLNQIKSPSPPSDFILKYVDGFWRMTTHSVLLMFLLLLLLLSWFLLALLQLLCSLMHVCVCVAMLCRVVSFSFASLAAPAKRFMCAFCRLLFVATRCATWR